MPEQSLLCSGVSQYGLGNPVEFLLSAGNDHDSVHAVELLEKVGIRGSAVLADRAYGARAIREYISAHGASYVIPPQSNVSDPWPVDWHLYNLHIGQAAIKVLRMFQDDFLGGLTLFRDHGHTSAVQSQHRGT
ncbi:transposase [Oscillibacter sp. PC13]|uniref:transposase n=1 Tax=Oscillibacter sp. PC13 TaxID=1855299 RepID=UPI000B84BEFF|nr:transposase [Oscillibacter sp. PC13]